MTGAGGSSPILPGSDRVVLRPLAGTDEDEFLDLVARTLDESGEAAGAEAAE